MIGRCWLEGISLMDFNAIFLDSTHNFSLFFYSAKTQQSVIKILRVIVTKKSL